MSTHRVVMILANGLSFSALKLLDSIDLTVLQNTTLSSYYPEALAYRSLERLFPTRGYIDASSSRLCRVTSADPLAQFVTGLPQSYLRLCADASMLRERNLLGQLRRQGHSVGVVTNSTITDSAVTGLLFPEALQLYTNKNSMHFAENDRFEEYAASHLVQAPWDFLAGGGREWFFPQNCHDDITGEPGKRKDDRNVLVELGHHNIELVDERSFGSHGTQVLHTRRLCLINHNYPNYQAERVAASALEPSLSEMLVAGARALERSSSKGWFLVVESGRLDHAAHLNHSIFLLGELLELAKTLSVALDLARELRATVVFTSDHPTGGLNITDTGALPFDAFQAGLSWSSGPESLRRDDMNYRKNGHLHTIEKFTPSSEQNTVLRHQVSAIDRTLADHDRNYVPLLASGPDAEAFRNCLGHADLRDAVAQIFDQGLLCSTKGNRAVVVVTGPPGVGKTEVATILAKACGGVGVHGDNYLNAIENSFNVWSRTQLDATFQDIQRDCERLAKEGKPVILDFVVLAEEDLIALDSIRRAGIEVHLFVLDLSAEDCLQRDRQRAPEEQMGDRCAVLAEEYARKRIGLEKRGAMFLDASRTPVEIVKEICTRAGLLQG